MNSAHAHAHARQAAGGKGGGGAHGGTLRKTTLDSSFETSNRLGVLPAPVHSAASKDTPAIHPSAKGPYRKLDDIRDLIPQRHNMYVLNVCSVPGFRLFVLSTMVVANDGSTNEICPSDGT